MPDYFPQPKLYAHHSQVPLTAFKARWPNFSPEELDSRGDGSILIDPDALDKLQALRTRLGRPLIINSAYRDPAYNARVGGAPSSYHMKSMAFDISMTNHNPAEFEAAAVAVGFRGIGHYPHSNFMHIDTRPTARVVRFKGAGKNNAWFPAVASGDGGGNFTPPPRPTSLKDTVLELAPVATPALGVGVAATQGNGPFQYALAVALVVAMIAGAIWVFQRKKATNSDA